MGRYNRKPAPAYAFAKSPSRDPQRDASGLRSNPELGQIAVWLSKVRFRRKLFGGFDPADVWKKLEELNGMYEMALAAERGRCGALAEQAHQGGAPEGTPAGISEERENG